VHLQAVILRSGRSRTRCLLRCGPPRGRLQAARSRRDGAVNLPKPCQRGSWSCVRSQESGRGLAYAVRELRLLLIFGLFSCQLGAVQSDRWFVRTLRLLDRRAGISAVPMSVVPLIALIFSLQYPVDSCLRHSCVMPVGQSSLFGLRIGSCVCHVASTKACSARSMARPSAAALFTHSSYSLMGTESATSPAPACEMQHRIPVRTDSADQGDKSPSFATHDEQEAKASCNRQSSSQATMDRA